MNFPEGFLRGTATVAYRVDGNIRTIVFRLSDKEIERIGSFICENS